MTFIHLRPWESGRTFHRTIDANILPLNVVVMAGKDSSDEIEAMLKAMQRRRTRLQETRRKVEDLEAAIKSAKDTQAASRKYRPTRKS